MRPEVIIPVLAIVCFFGTVSGLAYLFFTTRNRERLALIKKDKDATIFNVNPSKDESLKWGLMTVGTGVGFFIGGLVTNMIHLPFKSAFYSMPLIFGGLGLIGYYLWIRQRDAK